ncbi:hypothetical protein [Cohnella zeiphila]|uniref:Uncharacterized protein n=1 Tax=Cohnella zeiphila TaxID=2761120 RepID=A0A7X0SKT3_9BACL|nr:hypothetical protein [Cohnella zeiphila]MBB6730545.1 hypothetical protein [Cohnella zeiphila]
MRKSFFGPLTIVLLALFLLGIFEQIRMGSRMLLIPIALVAIVFLLYKFPPDRLFGRGRSSERAKYRQAAAASKRRQSVRQDTPSKRRAASPFRVIEGNKKKDDEPPTYH